MKLYEDINFWLPYLLRWDSEKKGFEACPHAYARYQGYPITMSDGRVILCRTSIPEKFTSQIPHETVGGAFVHKTNFVNVTFKLLPKFSMRFVLEVENLSVYRQTGHKPSTRPVVDVNVWNHGCFTCYTDNPKAVFKVDKRSSFDEVEEILALMKLTG